ncbi:YidC/Oxa1 family membrane protein insertase [Candidatus Saccharibacteria bacterium]|nr:YidC/Oxa1 family membrane protein insertase [Candidatus Saccharibacteria bacterium]
MFRLIDFLIVRPITNLLFLIYNGVDDFGLAIIIFVILVKLCMWPLVKRQLHQTKLMKKLQPELAEIKKNCKGNRQLESLQTMDLYKKYNVKPFRSVLSLLIQLPMLIAIFGAIRVMVTAPTEGVSKLDQRAYSFVKSENSNISEVISLQNAYIEKKSAYDAAVSGTPSDGDSETSFSTETHEAPVYEFHPRLFNIVNLEEKPGLASPSAIVALFFSILSCLLQYLTSKQQRPSGKSKSKSFRQLMKEAGEGKELDQAEINDMSSAQMSYLMPIMLLFIMLSLPGALILYYFLSSLITYGQQWLVLHQTEQELEVSADKAILKELKTAQEAQIIQNKQGQTVTRISANNKKKRR